MWVHGNESARDFGDLAQRIERLLRIADKRLHQDDIAWLDDIRGNLGDRPDMLIGQLGTRPAQLSERDSAARAAGKTDRRALAIGRQHCREAPIAGTGAGR